MNELPPLFLKRLEEILPKEHFVSSLESFSSKPALSVRINTLKVPKNQIIEILKDKGIAFKEVSWFSDALMLEGITKEELVKTDLINVGYLYIQNLSSMLVPIILDPNPGERVLDMCAAPGSKTTQVAALMKNKGEILAVERVKPRFYKLKSVVKLLGADIVSFKLMDARKLRIGDKLFDRVLIDAPCSSEGRFKTFNKKTYAYWSLRKIKEMARKQKGLLLSASRLLKVGGVLVYSTCSFAPEENEAAVNWLLKKTNGAIRLEKINLPQVKSYPSLLTWNNRSFNKEITSCLRVLPDEEMEGFFVAKLVKTA